MALEDKPRRGGLRNDTTVYNSLALVLGACCLSVALSALVAFHLEVGLVVVAGILTLAAAAYRPHWCLIVGVVLTLAGGEYATLAGAGLAVLLVSASVSLMSLIKFASVSFLVVAALPLALLGWLLVRFLWEGPDPTSRAIAACIGVVVLALESVRRGVNLARGMGVAGLLFAFGSSALGVSNEMGTRFEGLSGNPNRMVFGLLVFLPFMLSMAGWGKSWVLKGLAISASAVAIVLVMKSGSSQGTVGLICLGLAGIAWLMADMSRWGKVFFWAMTAASAVMLGVFALGSTSLPDDLVTLSGRTDLFEAAITQFLNEPWTGSGVDRVSAGSVLDRSAHSATLAILASAGILGGLLWGALLIALFWAGARELGRRELVGAAAILVVVLQLVQTVQYQPLTWVVIMLAVLSLRRKMRSPEGEALD